MKKIKTLLIGTGNIAKEHYRAFSNFKEFKFLGVVGRNRNKLKEFAKEFKIPNYSRNIEELHSRLNPDLVIVAISIMNTFKVCKQLSKFDSKIFVEKPFGYNYQQTLKLNKLFNERKKNIFIALNRRHYQTTRTIQDEIKNKSGKRTVIVNDQAILKTLKYKFPAKVIKNYMYANSIHLIDYFTIFCRGNLKKVTSLNKFDKEPYFVNSKLYFTSGDIGIYSAVYDRESPWYLSVFVNKSAYVLKPLEKIFSNKKIKKKKIKFSDDKKYKPGFKLQAKEVLNLFQNSKHNLPNQKEYFKSVKLINKIYK